MKNIHILPTEKARLYKQQGKLYDNKKTMHIPDGTQIPQKIYITSDEDIKEGDYGIDIRDSKVFKCERTLSNHYEFGVLQFQKSYCKKIILTTDQDLIADGVQAIDEEFLEWFVKNSNCEYVEITRPNKCKVAGCDLECILFKTCENIYIGYEIIIPQEEPKQETLEEAANKYVEDFELSFYDTVEEIPVKEIAKKDFIQGAKWQQERMYSEEEVKEIIKLSCEEGMLIQRTINDKVKIPYMRIKDFAIKMFTQFKKK
jgi:hypothetical protein